MSLSQNLSKNKSNKEILDEASALLTGRWITDLSNISALLMSSVADINWVGFYLTDSTNTLWLGPFQGLPACTMIPLNKGVCGAAATQQKTIVVEDVDQFPGHIVCDSRSKSEIVVPLIIDGKLVGVLDVDSASLNRFGQNEVQLFEGIVETLLKTTTPLK
jgi:L-methionine (R)-S-oxide reductase